MTVISYFSDLKATIRSMVVVAILIFGVSAVASAERSAEEIAYMDLVFGHCVENISGAPMADRTPEPETWEPVEGFDVSEPEMEAGQKEGAVDLRFKQVGDAELMVDMKNQEVCWTQIADVQAETMAARIRLAVLDSAFAGQVLEEKVEVATSGQVSRVTVLGLLEWDDVDMPVFIIREMLQPRAPALTTQVMMGQKQPQ